MVVQKSLQLFCNQSREDRCYGQKRVVCYGSRGVLESIVKGSGHPGSIVPSYEDSQLGFQSWFLKSTLFKQILWRRKSDPKHCLVTLGPLVWCTLLAVTSKRWSWHISFQRYRAVLRMCRQCFKTLMFWAHLWLSRSARFQAAAFL